MKIKVTQEDIEEGLPRAACACPISLAMKKAGIKANVTQTYVRIVGRKIFDGGLVELPEIAKNFVRRFDTGKSVVPFEFELEIK